MEFPVVIYPFVNSVTHRNFGKKNWLPVFEQNLSKKILIPFNENFREYSKSFKTEYDSTSSKEEQDNLNLLYVALTRAIDELHLISEHPKSQSINSHNEIVRSFLESSEKWRDDVNKYSWGKTEIKEKDKNEDSTTFLTAFETKHIQPKPSGRFSNDKIIFGNIFHEFMSKIEFESDYSKEKNDLNLSISVNKSIKKQVLSLSKKVIEHPDLKQYFSKKHTVYC